MDSTCGKLYLSCFCCFTCPGPSWLPSSVVTRISYFFIFLLSIILIVIFYFCTPLTRILPFCYNDDSYMCLHYSHYMAVYRVAFPFGLFFFILSLATIKVRSSRSHRAPIQNGLWFYKILILTSMLLGFLCLPFGIGDRFFMMFGLLSLMWVNIIELLIYMQVTNDLTELSTTYLWTEGSACTKFLYIFLGAMFFLSGAAIAVVLHIVYGTCMINLIFIDINLCLTYIISVISAMVYCHKRDQSGILKGSVLTTHVMLITWTALTNNPDLSCNPSKTLAYWMFVITNSFIAAKMIITGTLGVIYYYRLPQMDYPSSLVFVEERGKECFGVWGKRRIVGTLQPNVPPTQPIMVIYKSTNERDDEYEQLSYVWSAVHGLLSEVILAMMICATQNYIPKFYTGPIEFGYENEQAMWFKMASSWVCIVVFIVKDFCGVSLF